MNFDVIVADPPWSFDDKLDMSAVKRGAAAQYSVLDIEAIKALRVKCLAAPDAVLALWVPSSLLQEGLDTMKAWGFKQTQTHIWVKTKKFPLEQLYKTVIKSIKNKATFSDILDLFENFSLSETISCYLGHLFRQTHEICLLGVRGRVYKHMKNKSQRSVHFGHNLKHSAKPEDLQNMLDLMFPTATRLEIFARRSRPGWSCIGLECPDTMGEDVRDSIDRLIQLP